jgi:uncharacterized protein YjbJ (UPF0337 family)
MPVDLDKMHDPPLVVDLDGTLIATAIVREGLYRLARERPWLLPLLPFYRLRGRAGFRDYVAHIVEIEPERLPYRREVLEFLREEKACGRRLILATAAHRRIADAVAQYLGLFEVVIASDHTHSLQGVMKLAAIRQRVRGGVFDYMGDKRTDVPIFQAARMAIFVHPSTRLRKRTRASCWRCALFVLRAEGVVCGHGGRTGTDHGEAETSPGGGNMAEPQPRRGASNITTPDILSGQWQQLRGQIRSWWGQLTESDVDKIAGKKDLLVGLIQERYGYARQRAEQEVEQRLKEYSDQRDASGVHQRMEEHRRQEDQGETGQPAGQDVAARLPETVGKVRATVQETAATALATVVARVKGAGESPPAKRMVQITGDVAGVMRRYPAASVLLGLGMGLGIGLLVGRRRG